ncbi:hypothetical protein GIB67_028371 [Kingdonia uniflora]|uniref:Uncharacterized protein n=1 Tax=Kingdonia uniflora TaxID=39325 RepID=A0A7J7MHS8_9MAGN|nr:hypothetical protein GIB67_028371 [Kingdonia uniflora]
MEAHAIGVPTVGAPAIGSSSSATEIGVVVVRQVTPGKGLEVVKDLMVDDDVKVNLEAISSEYGGGLLKSSTDQTTVVSIEEQTLEVEKIKDEASQAIADQTTVVYIEEQTIEVAQTDIVIPHQEEDVGEASQSKEEVEQNKEEVEQNKEEVIKGKDDDDGNSQNKPDPESLMYTLKL